MNEHITYLEDRNQLASLNTLVVELNKNNSSNYKMEVLAN